jgi:hypothetical protein
MSDEYDNQKYVDNPRNYMAGPKAPKGSGFAERVTLPSNDIVAPGITSARPLNADPHGHDGPQRPETRYQSGAELMRASNQARAIEREGGRRDR